MKKKQWKVAIRDTEHKGNQRFEGEITEGGEVTGYVWGKTFAACEASARERKATALRYRLSRGEAVEVEL